MHSSLRDDFRDHIQQLTQWEQTAFLRQLLARNNTAKIFIASENNRYPYPYRLAHADRIGDRIRSVAQELIIDSAIGNTTITNEEILEIAIQYDAQWVIPNDYLGDIKATYQSAREFEELYQNSSFRGSVIYPLQPPHDDHYRRYEDFYREKSFLAIGGIADDEPHEQVSQIKTLRETVGVDQWLHGFGLGVSPAIINALQDDPHLLDSLDVSTFERLPSLDQIFDDQLERHQVSLPNGKHRSTLNAKLTEFLVYEFIYQLTPYCDEFDTAASSVIQPSTEQTSLTEEWRTSE